MGNRDYSVAELLQMEACTNCRVCADVCPAVAASGDGRLSGVYRIKGLRQLLKGRVGFLQRLLRKSEPSRADLEEFGRTVFRCTLCGNCQEVCPLGIHLKDLWISLRQDLVHSDAGPKKIEMIRENLKESRNVFAEDNEERADWVEDMREPPEHGFLKESARVVYFTGCVASYFPLAQKIPVSVAEILDAGDVDFTLLGQDEWCCGFPMLGAGLKEMFREFMEHNVEAVAERDAREVVFACPSCYQMWREYYEIPEGIRIFHASQFLLRLAEEDRLPFKRLDMTVTYHDPCDLGRGARVFEEPRALIRAIPGVRLVELSQNRDQCRCCGGGGNLEMIDAGLSAEMARAKMDEVLATGADAVVTACQQCVRTMTTFAKRNKIPLEVLDIAQLVNRALKE